MTVTELPLTMESPGLTSHQIVLAAGITYRQLDYWARTGHIPAVDRIVSVGSGVPRRWTDDECAFVVTLARLVRAGVRIDVASKALREQSYDGHLPDLIHLDCGICLSLRPQPEQASV